nr:hypothetical protein [uncultured Rhodopila sp.]
MSNIPVRAAFQIEAGRLEMHAFPAVSDAPVPVLRMVQCAERELRRRRRWYSNRVMAGRMSVAEAMSEIWEMEGIVDTLRDVAGCPTGPEINSPAVGD